MTTRLMVACALLLSPGLLQAQCYRGSPDAHVRAFIDATDAMVFGSARPGPERQRAGPAASCPVLSDALRRVEEAAASAAAARARTFVHAPEALMLDTTLLRLSGDATALHYAVRADLRELQRVLNSNVVEVSRGNDRAVQAVYDVAARNGAVMGEMQRYLLVRAELLRALDQLPRRWRAGASAQMNAGIGVHVVGVAGTVPVTAGIGGTGAGTGFAEAGAGRAFRWAQIPLAALVLVQYRESGDGDELRAGGLIHGTWNGLQLGISLVSGSGPGLRVMIR